MTGELNPAAPHHLPIFFTAPGQPDYLFNAMLIFLIVAVLLIVVLYFKLHALPEQIAHKGQKVQFEIVAVLALISLFTHNHLFWIAGLLLAFIPLQDFSTPLGSMADSLAKMAGRTRQARIPAVSQPEVAPAAGPVAAGDGADAREAAASQGTASGPDGRFEADAESAVSVRLREVTGLDIDEAAEPGPPLPVHGKRPSLVPKETA